MGDVPAPSRKYTEPIYRRMAGFLAEHGLGADTAVAGCARCLACSSLNLIQQTGSPAPAPPAGTGAPTAPLLQIGKHPGPGRRAPRPGRRANGTFVH